MQIALENPSQQADVVALIEELDAYQLPLYPAESHHGIDIDALSASNVLFAVARLENGEAIGCGAMVLAPDYGELKRMYTKPSRRGRGVGGRLLSYLEAEARSRGCTMFVLETGCLQQDALALYERNGYVRCGPFGKYGEDSNSVYMRKNAA